LKPCPFCGCTALVVFHNRPPQHGYSVICTECQTSGPYDLGWSGAEEAWNTRPGEDVLHTEIERLKKLVVEHHEMGWMKRQDFGECEICAKEGGAR
jgi:Lar family restriction alleviation protein